MGGTITRSAFEDLARGFENNPVFGHMHSYDLYRNWLEAMWAFLDAVHDQEGFRQCLDRYKREEGEEFGRLLGLYVDAVVVDPFRDILGELFMRLDVNSVRAGQFFTPEPIAEMMARMQFDEESFKRLVEEKGAVTVCDPAVGSGVMLLSFAKVVHQALGRWGTGKLRLYGTDIDIRCVNMCRIQLRMNGLDSFGRMAGLLAGQVSVTSQEAIPDVIPDAVPDVVIRNGQQELPGFAA
jgi:hypothetical protein